MLSFIGNIYNKGCVLNLFTCSKNNYYSFKKSLKFIICNISLLLLLCSLFFISYSFTLKSENINNTPQSTINSFCKTINNSEFNDSVNYIDESYDIALLLKNNYKKINIENASMYTIIHDNEDATYNATFYIEETSLNGEIIKKQKEIPIRFHKKNNTWYLTNSSVKSIFDKL